MGNDFKNLMFLIILATCALLIMPILTEKHTFIDCSLTLLGFYMLEYCLALYI